MQFARQYIVNPTDDFLQRKIRITNFVAMLYGILSVPFSIFTFFYYQNLMLYPTLFQLAAFSVFLANRWHQYHVSRFIICAIFPTIYVVYASYLLPDDHHLIAPFYAIQIVFWIPPWLVFDMRERTPLFLYVSFYAIISLALPFLNPLFSMEADIIPLREGALSWVLYVVSILAISGGLFFLRLQSYVAEKHNETLLKQLQETNAETLQKNQQLQQQQEEIITQNEELRQNQEEIVAQRDFIEEQNQKLYHTNKLLNFSIRAGKAIQQAALPYPEKLEKMLQKYFIIYKPRDVVSGDFYWLNQIDTKTILVAADCTGHGVPGAFMTLIGSNLLDKIIRVWRFQEPAQILNRLHEEIQIVLNQKETANNNGMDMSIIALQKKGQETEVVFAGAKQNLYYIRPSENILVECKGNRKSIGGLQNEAISFEQETFILPPKSRIYLGTDGIEDQNDVQRRKFSRKRLQELLLQTSSLPLETQKDVLEKALQEHMQGCEQRDDILWIGLEIH